MSVFGDLSVKADILCSDIFVQYLRLPLPFLCINGPVRNRVGPAEPEPQLYDTGGWIFWSVIQKHVFKI